LDEITDKPVKNRPIHRLQYFPQTINDTYQTNYVAHQIPGGSLPIYQWVSGGPRTISFDTYFSCDVDLLSKGTQQGKLLVERLEKIGQIDRNVDIRSAVAWLRRYMYPQYKTGETTAVSSLTYAPRKILLVMPGSGIGVSSNMNVELSSIVEDSIYCHMTSCDVTYMQYHKSGLPKIAMVKLSFEQEAQVEGRVNFPSMPTDLKDGETFTTYYKYPLVASNSIKGGALVLTNGINTDTTSILGDGFSNGLDNSTTSTLVPDINGGIAPKTIKNVFSIDT